jgi:hypothetical protein
MNTIQNEAAETSIFENSYDREIFEDNWKFFRNKTMRSIFFVAAIILGADLFALIVANLLDNLIILYVLIVPVIFAGLGIMARFRPLLASSLTAILYVAIVCYTVYQVGPTAIFAGWLVKAVIVYFLITGIQSAREAEEARRKMMLFL